MKTYTLAECAAMATGTAAKSNLANTTDADIAKAMYAFLGPKRGYK